MKSTIERYPDNISVAVQEPREGVSAGVTVGDFKAALSRLAGDNELLASIEYGCAREVTGWIVVERNESGVEIREARR